VLGEVSRAIALDEQAAGAELEARFCTVALATVEPRLEGTRVVLSLGGHPRPMLVRPTGDVTEVGVPGSLLGVLADPELHDVTLWLAPGELLVMFTDGVIEARRGSDAFGEARLTALLGRLAGSAPQHVVEEVVRTVRAFSQGEDARDDVAVLVVGVPAGAAASGDLGATGRVGAGA
jgi:phosphoserine phosphatase RsbU/P